MKILFEDALLLAVDKPAGLTSEAGPHARHETAESWARDYLTTQAKGRAPAYLRAVHRLDRPASGVLLLAKSKTALSELMRQFEARSVQKIYRVAVEKPLAEAAGTLRHWLVRDESGKRALAYDTPQPGAQLAELSYRQVAENRYDVELHTGRFHQIRAQFARVGHPIAGDVAYGAAPWQENQIMLHARQLIVQHPRSGERLAIGSEPAW